MKNVKKKNAVLLGLVACMLAISIANYTVFYNDDTSVSNVEDGPSNATLVSNVTEEDILSGNAELSSEFFSEYRLNRDKVRSQNLEALQNITKDTSLDKEIIKEAVEESVSISKLSETELVVENLIKAKGFDDAIVIIHAGYANVIVDAASLSPSDAAQIQNIVNKECNIAISKVTIATSNNSEKQDTEEKNEDGENTNNTENSQNNS
ncbi:SpoIIIAH-like family protein [Anaerofustis butyriciformans]|uniref:SpoIIIAH-like family protein n=1 Tax=Anaerofustis TaxID=264995 RepID=UPI003F8C5D02